MNINSTTTDRSSFANNQEQKDTHDGTISVVPPEKTIRLLHTDEWLQVFSHLDNRDIISTTLFLENARMEIFFHYPVIYNAWLSLFTPQQQASFKRRIEKMSETEADHWTFQFSREKPTTRFLKKRTTAHYAESLIFNRTLSMCTCPNFNVEEKCIIKHDAFFKSATFSTNGLHLATASRDHTARLYRQDSSGEWALKIIFKHFSVLVPSPIFSPDDSHVIAISDSKTATIYGQDSKGKWVQKAEVEYPAEEAFSVTFSADSRHAMLTNTTPRKGVVQIYGRNANDEWTRKANIKMTSHRITTLFSPDSRNMLITNCSERTRIYEQNSSGGTWCAQDTPRELDKTATLATFSADSRHVAIVHQDDSSTGIYGLNLTGKWTQKILINNKSVNLSSIKPTFSNNGRFVIILSDADTVVQIYGQSSSGKWTEKAIIQHEKRVGLMSFSPDSRHVVTHDWSGTIQIYSKIANDQWIKKATIQYEQRKFFVGEIISNFSADSRQMLTASNLHSAIKIYRWHPNEEWIEYSTIDIGVKNALSEATFSADGYHVIIVTTNTVKIYGLNSTDNTWKEKAHIEHANVNRASISADGGHVVTVDRSNGIAKIWRLSPEKNEDKLKTKAGSKQ